MSNIIILVTMVMMIQTTTTVYGMHIRVEFGNFEHLTCYTCQQNRNNEDCNSWAPNIPCPLNHTVCMTRHRFNNVTDESLQVDKLCTYPEQCTLEHVGCHDTDVENVIECVSCCSKSFCNTAVTYNTSMSVHMSSDLVKEDRNHATTWSIEIFNMLVCLVLLTLV